MASSPIKLVTSTTHATRIKLKCLIEGMDSTIPVSSAQVTCQPDAPATASISIPPIDGVLDLKPKSRVFLFFSNTADSYDSKLDDDEWKLLFGGQLLSTVYVKNRQTRSFNLNCADFYSFGDTVFVYQMSLDSSQETFMNFAAIEGGADWSGVDSAGVGKKGRDVIDAYDGNTVTGKAFISQVTATTAQGDNSPEENYLAITPHDVKWLSSSPTSELSAVTAPYTQAQAKFGTSSSYTKWKNLVSDLSTQQVNLQEVYLGRISTGNDQDAVNALLRFFPRTCPSFSKHISPLFTKNLSDDSGSYSRYLGLIELLSSKAPETQVSSSVFNTVASSANATSFVDATNSKSYMLYHDNTATDKYFNAIVAAGNDISYVKLLDIVNLWSVSATIPDNSLLKYPVKVYEKETSVSADKEISAAACGWGLGVFLTFKIRREGASLPDFVENTTVQSLVKEVTSPLFDSNVSGLSVGGKFRRSLSPLFNKLGLRNSPLVWRRVKEEEAGDYEAITYYFEYGEIGGGSTGQIGNDNRIWKEKRDTVFEDYISFINQALLLDVGEKSKFSVKTYTQSAAAGITDSIIALMAECFTQSAPGNIPKVYELFYQKLMSGGYINPFSQWEIFRFRVLNQIVGPASDPFAMKFFDYQFVTDVLLKQLPQFAGNFLRLTELNNYLFGKTFYSYIPNPVCTYDTTGFYGRLQLKSMLYAPKHYFNVAPECNKLKADEYMEFVFERHALTETTRLGVVIQNDIAVNSDTAIPFLALENYTCPTDLFYTMESRGTIQEHERFTGILPDWTTIVDYRAAIESRSIKGDKADVVYTPGRGNSASKIITDIPESWHKAVHAAAAETGLDHCFIRGLIMTESAWNPQAVSKTGAFGLGQFFSAAWTDVQRYAGGEFLKCTRLTATPEQQIRASAIYLKICLNSVNNITTFRSPFTTKLLAGIGGYNQGYPTILLYLKHKKSLPQEKMEEVTNYIKKVPEYWRAYTEFYESDLDIPIT